MKHSKYLIIYESIHQGNTKKIADAMGGALDATLVKASEVKPEQIKDAELIGFGSGIYFGKTHKNILELIKKMGVFRKKAFTFSTHGAGANNDNRKLRKLLENKGFAVLGNFSCTGFDEFGPLKLIGGLNKGKPDAADVKNAAKFAMEMKRKAE